MSNSVLSNDHSDINLLNNEPFTAVDHEILKSYEAAVDGLAMLIGAHCEIVLHSLEDLKCSAVRIANGQHTGRQIGSPITDLALRMLHDMADEESNVSKAYFTKAKSGDLMKSVTIAIRNRHQRVIGLLCINMNLDVPFSEIIKSFVPEEKQEITSDVNFASSVDDLVAQTLEFTIEEVGADRNVSNNAKNKQVVLNLYEKGIFDIKDAINQVADRLNISKHTVYLYIRQFKSEEWVNNLSHTAC
nr:MULTISPECIES: transcriptional regulator [Providencia]